MAADQSCYLEIASGVLNKSPTEPAHDLAMWLPWRGLAFTKSQNKSCCLGGLLSSTLPDKILRNDREDKTPPVTANSDLVHSGRLWAQPVDSIELFRHLFLFPSQSLNLSKKAQSRNNGHDLCVSSVPVIRGFSDLIQGFFQEASHYNPLGKR